jgi:hypothetical protein
MAAKTKAMRKNSTGHAAEAGHKVVKVPAAEVVFVAVPGCAFEPWLLRGQAMMATTNNTIPNVCPRTAHHVNRFPVSFEWIRRRDRTKRLPTRRNPRNAAAAMAVVTGSGSRTPVLGLVSAAAGAEGIDSFPVSKFARLKARPATRTTAKARRTGTAHEDVLRGSRTTYARKRSEFITIPPKAGSIGSGHAARSCSKNR